MIRLEGRALGAAKVAAQQALWARVQAQHWWERRSGQARALPAPVAGTDILESTADVDAAMAECRRLRLPRHRDRPKNWDALGAVATILHQVGPDCRVLDAGAARYSSVLPWLYLYGVRELVGNNLEFTQTTSFGPVRFEPGDITDTQYRTGWFDVVTCMSVIEHGVELDHFATEAARILRPGGLLIVSTDFDQHPPAVEGKTAYGVPVRIFGPADILDLVRLAGDRGLQLQGPLRLEHEQRPVHWQRTGLDYTFIRLAFVRQAR